MKRTTKITTKTTAALGAICVSMFCVGASPAPQDGERIEETRAVIERWVETRRVISKEKQDWKLGREMLESRIDLVQNEIDGLRTKIEDSEQNITEADEKRAELVAENDALKDNAAALRERVVALENRTRALLRRLPAPIVDRIKPLSQRLPDEKKEVKMSMAERFQNVVGILNEINKFNREITVTSEVRTLPDGSSAEVAVLYVGIGQAYYVGRENSVGGVGTASADGWTWTPANDAAPAIARAIAILKNEEIAAFVPLPFEVK